MAATPRTNSTLVAGIVDVQTGVDLAPFIAPANLLTTQVCGNHGMADDGVGSQMELIERWLSAHFYTIFDQQLSAAKAGTVAVQYQYKIDMGLQSSFYGQTAMRLDTSGELAKWDNAVQEQRKITIDIGWLGVKRRSFNPFWPFDISVNA